MRPTQVSIVSTCCGADVNTDSLICSECCDYCGCTCFNCENEWWDDKGHDCEVAA